MTHATTSIFGYFHPYFSNFLHFPSNYPLTAYSGLDHEDRV